MSVRSFFSGVILAILAISVCMSSNVMAQDATYELKITGSDFTPRSSGTYYYEGGGCISTASDIQYSVSLILPDGATITGATFHYYDAHAGGNADDEAELRIYAYNNRGDLMQVGEDMKSSGTPGYSSDSITLNTQVDYDLFSYSLVWYPNVFNDQSRICGAEITYTVPEDAPGVVVIPMGD